MLRTSILRQPIAMLPRLICPGKKALPLNMRCHRIFSNRTTDRRYRRYRRSTNAVILRPAIFAGLRIYAIAASTGVLAQMHRFFASQNDKAPNIGHHNYLCSKSTGAVTSCTLKYFASAGYFLATASYIAYATLRYETCPAGVVRNSEM